MLSTEDCEDESDCLAETFDCISLYKRDSTNQGNNSFKCSHFYELFLLKKMGLKMLKNEEFIKC